MGTGARQPMAHLTLAGVSDDGQRLLLVSDAGLEFTLDIDTRLRAALRGEHARFGQLEIKMDSALRPRDIQARIRAGETAEAVAQAAQTSVDKIMAFAAPVLAERQHVADRAQRSSVRRDGGHAAAGARTLGDAVSGHLRALNVDPGSVEWDAWRREDGRWTLTGSYSSATRKGTAEFTFDNPGNYVTVDNEDAKWLIGETVASARETPAARDDLRSARQRRLSSVPEDELPLGDDAIELVSGSDPASDTLGTEQPVEAFLDDTPPTDPEVEAEAADLRDEATDAAAEDHGHEDEPPSRRPVKKTRGRASVPSWDEIMFGGGTQE
ncbi:septation protein SepH [Nocardioides sp. PD653]|uniref:septation protein SepH n=2 Tax=unclassified Nocardioides TaxID=2615069 RepID=UPI000A26A4EF